MTNMTVKDKIIREKVLATIAECKSKTPFLEISYNFMASGDGSSIVDNPECLNKLFDFMRDETNKHCYYKDDAEIDINGLTRNLIQEIDFDKDHDVQQHAFGYTNLTVDHNVYIAHRLNYGESPKKTYKSMFMLEAKVTGRTNEVGKYISGEIRVIASKVSIHKLNDKIIGKERNIFNR